MNAEDAPIQVANAPDRHRYEISVDDALAGFAEYQVRRDREPPEIVFTHTEIDDAYEGQGLGSRLIEHALADVRLQEDLVVVPRCPFVTEYIRRNPQEIDLVADSERARVTG